MDKRHPPTPYFAVCLNNEGYPASLEVGKLYRVIPDEEAAVHGYIRVIDETHGEPGSEDGYLYPSSMFVPIELPEVAEHVLMTAGDRLLQSA